MKVFGVQEMAHGFDFGLTGANQLGLCTEAPAASFRGVSVFPSNTGGWMPPVLWLLSNPS